MQSLHGVHSSCDCLESLAVECLLVLDMCHKIACTYFLCG